MWQSQAESRGVQKCARQVFRLCGKQEKPFSDLGPMVTAFCGNAPFPASRPLTATRSCGSSTRFLFEPFGTSEFFPIVAQKSKKVKKKTAGKTPIFFLKSIYKLPFLCYTERAKQNSIFFPRGYVFLFLGKNAYACFFPYSYWENEFCLATIEAMRFSVRITSVVRTFLF